MKVTREIAVYEKWGEKFIERFEINVSLKNLLQVINPDMADDPELLRVYPLSKIQYDKLMDLEPKLKKIDFRKFEVFYECHRPS